MSKTKWFRVAVEGATATDGRIIEKQWLSDIGAGYKRETYGARVNLEHIRGFTPDGPFKAYGDVLAVKTENVTIELNGKSETRLALFAQVDPTDELVKFTKARQKIYTSIEVAPNFANSGKAGLVGLAVTDSPASLGTDILSFSAKPEGAALKAMFDGRKTAADNLFSEGCETSIEIEPETTDGVTAGGFFADFMAAAVSKLTGASPAGAGAAAPQTLAAPAASPGAGGEATGDQFKVLMSGLEALSKDMATAETKRAVELAAITATVTELKTKLDETPAGGPVRQHSTGGAGQVLADC